MTDDDIKTEWLTPQQAAGKAGVDEKTIRRWCEKHGIGRKVSGRWHVSPERLQSLLDLEREPAPEWPVVNAMVECPDDPYEILQLLIQQMKVSEDRMFLELPGANKSDENALSAAKTEATAIALHLFRQIMLPAPPKIWSEGQKFYGTHNPGYTYELSENGDFVAHYHCSYTGWRHFTFDPEWASRLHFFLSQYLDDITIGEGGTGRPH